MIVKQVSSSFSVSDQLTPDDVDTLAANGVRTLVCNRPDGEVAGQPSFADISKRAAQHGIGMHYLPVVHDTINSHNVRQFAATVMPELKKFDAGAAIDRSQELPDLRFAAAAE